MTMIIRVPGVDWAGKGFPNISPFVGLSDLEFGFDFLSRTNRLQDIAGKHADLVPYRQDIAGGITRTVDPTVVVDESGGLGVRVELGYLLTDIPCPTIPIDGSMQFTVMVAGGYSGVAFPPAKVAGLSASIAGLIDFGTGISAAGFDLESQGLTWGARIKSGGQNLSSNIATSSKKCVGFLTFNGTTWTLYNKTIGTTLAKTNTDLGISAAITPSTAHVNKVVMGHYHSTSTLSALYPSLYQVAKWNRVLTAAEIDEQYARTQANKSGLGL